MGNVNLNIYRNSEYVTAQVIGADRTCQKLIGKLAWAAVGGWGETRGGENRGVANQGLRGADCKKRAETDVTTRRFRYMFVTSRFFLLRPPPLVAVHRQLAGRGVCYMGRGGSLHFASVLLRIGFFKAHSDGQWGVCYVGRGGLLHFASVCLIWSSMFSGLGGWGWE